MEDVIGHFVLYALVMRRHYPEHTLYLAVPETVRRGVFEEEAGQVLLEDGAIRLFSFDPAEEVVVQWMA